MESNLKIVEWNIDKLISAEYNPRKLSEEQKQKIKDSISRFGLVDPVIVNTNKERFGIIIGGHQRTKVSREMGFKKMPCVELDLNLDQEKELNVRLNKNTGEFDKELLVEYFDQDDLIDWGFDNEYFEDVVTEIDAPEEDDFNGELPSEPQTVLGDLYELNGHRVHCASSTEIDAVEKLMDGKKADMVFTDPPYGVSYTNNNNDIHEVIMNDDVLLDFKPILLSFSKTNTHWYIWTSDPVYNEWREMYSDVFKSTIIWNKGGGAIGDLNGDYMRTFEFCLFCQNGRKELIGLRSSGVWDIKKDFGSNYVHPTQKPIELSTYAMGKSSKINDVVLDLFLGSGSTLIGSEQTQRKCYGQELDPKYCDVIVKRWVKYMTDNDRKFTVKRNGEDITKETWINE